MKSTTRRPFLSLLGRSANGRHGHNDPSMALPSPTGAIEPADDIAQRLALGDRLADMDRTSAENVPAWGATHTRRDIMNKVVSWTSVAAALPVGLLPALATSTLSEAPASAAPMLPNPELVALGEALKAAKAEAYKAVAEWQRWRTARDQFDAADPMPEPFHAEHISTCTVANKQAFDDECREWSARRKAAVGGGYGSDNAMTAAIVEWEDCAFDVAMFDARTLPDLMHKAILTFAEQDGGAKELSGSIVADLIEMHGQTYGYSL